MTSSISIFFYFRLFLFSVLSISVLYFYYLLTGIVQGAKRTYIYNLHSNVNFLLHMCAYSFCSETDKMFQINHLWRRKHTLLHKRINVSIRNSIGSISYAYIHGPITFLMLTLMCLCKSVCFQLKAGSTHFCIDA